MRDSDYLCKRGNCHRALGDGLMTGIERHLDAPETTLELDMHGDWHRKLNSWTLGGPRLLVQTTYLALACPNDQTFAKASNPEQERSPQTQVVARSPSSSYS